MPGKSRPVRSSSALAAPALASAGAVYKPAPSFNLRGSHMQFGFLLEQVVNGLVLGGYYLLIALGLSLIFSRRRHRQSRAWRVLCARRLHLRRDHEISRLRPGGGAVADRGGAARHSLRALHPAAVLRRRSDPEPAGDVRARHGHRTGDPHHLGRAADLGRDPAKLSRLGLPRRLPVLALSPADPRRRRRGPARRLAAAAQDLVRPRGARRHPAAGHGRRARHPAAALHDRDRHARRRHGSARRRVLCADHDRASGDGRRDHHGRLCRGRDRRSRQFLGRGARGDAGRRGQRHHHPFRARPPAKPRSMC